MELMTYENSETQRVMPCFICDTTAEYVPRKHHYNANNKRKKGKKK